MRQDVEGVRLGIPITPVEVIAILRNARQIDDPVIGGPGIGMRAGFAQIIETGPDKLAADIAILLHAFEFDIRNIGTRVVVIRIDLILVVAQFPFTRRRRVDIKTV